MPYLLRLGDRKGIALYTRCEDELLAKAELLFLKEHVEKDKQSDGCPILGYIDVDKTFSIAEFKASYHGKPADYRRLMELRQQIIAKGWGYPLIE